MSKVLVSEENLNNIADAIRNKNKSADTYKTNEMANAISLIDTGIDTSDATATANDMVAPATAYVNKQKITGNIIRKYKKAFKKIKISSLDLASTDNAFCVSPDTKYIALLHSTDVEIIDIHSNDSKKIAFVNINIPAGTYYNITLSIPDENGYRYITVKDSQSSGILYYFVYDIAKQQVIKTGNINTSLNSGHYSGAGTAPASIHPGWIYISGMCNNQSSFVGIINLDTETVEVKIYREWFTNITIDAQDRFVVVQYTNVGYTIDNEGKLTQNLNWFGSKYYINTEVEQAWNPSNGEVYKYEYDESTHTLSLITLLYNTNTRYGIKTVNPGGQAAFISENVFATLETGTYYKNTKISDYIISYSAVKNKNQCIHGIEYITVDNATNQYTLHSICDDENNIDTITSGETTLYNTSDATITTNDILQGKVAYMHGGKVEGSMSDNGELSYTPMTYQQTIPSGYTSGGNIKAVDSSIDSNLIPENIRVGVTILGVTGTYEGSEEK